MDPMEPVSWDDVIAVRGIPGEEVQPFVQRHVEEFDDGIDPAEAVERIYNDWKSSLGDERTLSDQGASFLIAYLLEHRGAISLTDVDGVGGSLLDRRPEDERLRSLFHEEERTGWWIAIEYGVHHELVTRWLYEADIPLLGRNLDEETSGKIAERTV